MTDWVLMFDRLGQSMPSVQLMLTWFAFVLALAFFIIALHKLYKIGDARANAGSGERMIVPIAYILAGSALLWFQQTYQILRNSFFGSDASVGYGAYSPFNFFAAFELIIQTVGILWFIRGCALLAESSKPGVQHGAKGFVFLIAGIMAMNFDYTINTISNGLSWFENATLATSAGLGY